MLNKIKEMYPEDEFLCADGFDDAIIGIDLKTMRLIYSVTMILDILMEDSNLSELDATEYFEFNIEGAYVGEKTPIWCYDNF